MNSLNFFQNIKRNLVKIFVIIFLGLSLPVNSFSNPIIPPPLLIEIYFGPEGWQIEMMYNEYNPWTSLDNVWLCGINDSAQFVTGMELIQGELLVVTQNDFMNEMEINQEGDWLTLYYIYGDGIYPVDEMGLFWGNIPVMPDYYFNRVTAPVGEQSIAIQELYDFNDFCVVKEKPNSIGSNPFEVSKRADFSGVVSDLNGSPLAGVEVSYGFYPLIITGSDGHFSVSNNMFCRIYNVNFVFDGGIIGDSTISIEPDVANYFEFKLDTLLTEINEFKPSTLQYSIFTIPNPSSSQTKFIIETSNPKPDQKGVIKIYSEAGFIVDIIPVEISGNKQEISYNFNDKSLASGMYFYNLETGHQKVPSGKMIVSQ
jgi:hypothetical protein